VSLVTEGGRLWKQARAKVMTDQILSDAKHALIPGRRELTDQQKDGGVEKLEVHASALGLKFTGKSRVLGAIAATAEALVPVETWPEVKAVLEAGGYL
jgi:hypothetical protein